MKTALYGGIVFGASAVLFGVIPLMWYDSDTWQTLRQIWSLPFGAIVGGCLMVGQIAGGIGMQYPQTVRLASIVLGIVYLLFSLACIPGIIAAPAAYPSFFEQFSALCGAFALYAATEANAGTGGRVRPSGAPRTRSLRDIVYAESDSLFLRDSRLGSKVDSAKSGFLGVTHDHRIRTRRYLHPHQSPGTACDTPDDPHAGTLWSLGLDSAPDRSPRSASELVRIRPDFAHYRRRRDGGWFEIVTGTFRDIE
jgi:hypothetical protein